MNLVGHDLLSNVSLRTADLLSYLMLVVVAVFLLSGPVVYYIFVRKNRKTKAADSTSPP